MFTQSQNPSKFVRN